MGTEMGDEDRLLGLLGEGEEEVAMEGEEELLLASPSTLISALVGRDVPSGASPAGVAVAEGGEAPPYEDTEEEGEVRDEEGKEGDLEEGEEMEEGGEENATMRRGDGAAEEEGARQQEGEEEGSGTAETGELGRKRKAEVEAEELREGDFKRSRKAEVTMRDASTQAEMGSRNTMRKAERRRGTERSGRRPEAGCEWEGAAARKGIKRVGGVGEGEGKSVG